MRRKSYSLRLSKETIDMIEAAAAAANQKPTVWARDVLVAAAQSSQDQQAEEKK